MNRLMWSVLLLGVALLGRTDGDRRVDTALKRELLQWRNRLGVPGITAAVVDSDGRLTEVAVGVANRETGEPMHPRDRMLAASIGKTFVGAAALTLEAEGRLDPDAPVAETLGGLAWFSRLPNAETITSRQLLTHTSGLPDHVHLPAFQQAVSRQWRKKENPFTPEVLTGFVLDRPALSAPGERWSYSDTGYVLLGMVLEQAAREPFTSMVEDRFLKPLGLRDTSPSDRRHLPGLVPGYTRKENPFGFPVRSTYIQGRMRWHPGLENLGGGWVTTSGDLVRWGHALFAGEALPESARPALRRTVATSSEPGAMRYGPGVGFRPEGPLGPVWGHGGWIPGYVSSLRHYSRQGLTVAFQINSDVVDPAVPDGWMAEMELGLARTVLRSRPSESRESPDD